MAYPIAHAWEAMALLCRWMKQSEAELTFDPGDDLAIDLSAWWEEHQRLDALHPENPHAQQSGDAQVQGGPASQREVGEAGDEPQASDRDPDVGKA